MSKKDRDLNLHSMPRRMDRSRGGTALAGCCRHGATVRPGRLQRTKSTLTAGCQALSDCRHVSP